METILWRPIKAEQGPLKEDAGGNPYTEIDIGLPDLKKECMEHSKSIAQTAGRVGFCI